MEKIIHFIAILTLCVARPEPPTNLYLPPGQRSDLTNEQPSSKSSSNQYRPPDFQDGNDEAFGSNFGSGSNNLGAPSRNYGQPVFVNNESNKFNRGKSVIEESGRLQNSYGPPSRISDFKGSIENGSGRKVNAQPSGVRPSDSYGLPSSDTVFGEKSTTSPSNSYRPPEVNRGFKGENGGSRTTSSSSGGYAGRNKGQAKPSNFYGPPQGNNGYSGRNPGSSSDENSFGRGNIDKPSDSYKTPVTGGRNLSDKRSSNSFDPFGNQNNGRPSNLYGPSSSGNGFGEESIQPFNSYGLPSDNNGRDASNGNGFTGSNKRPASTHGPSFGINSVSFGGISANDRPNNFDSFRVNGGSNERPTYSYGLPSNDSAFDDGINEIQGNNIGRQLSLYGTPSNENRVANTEKSSSNGYPQSQQGSAGNRNGYSATRSSNNGASNTRDDNISFDRKIQDSYGPPPSGTVRSNENGYSSDGSGINGYSSNRPGYSSGEIGRNGYSADGPGKNGLDEGNDELAKYEFSYEVKDDKSGSNFGHTEMRDGNRAHGEFNVLLPDGRKQIVEYEADQDGFKPQIRYEDEANKAKTGDSSGYPSNKPSEGQVRGQTGNNNREFSTDPGLNSGFNGGNQNDNSGYPSDPGNGRNNKNVGNDHRFNNNNFESNNGYPSVRTSNNGFNDNNNINNINNNDNNINNGRNQGGSSGYPFGSGGNAAANGGYQY